jgi:hypothetical protein
MASEMIAQEVSGGAGNGRTNDNALDNNEHETKRLGELYRIVDPIWEDMAEPCDFAVAEYAAFAIQ